MPASTKYTVKDVVNEMYYKNYRACQGAAAAKVDHSWLHNSVDCAFERCYRSSKGPVTTTSESWLAVHILHKYGIERYGYLLHGTMLPSIKSA